MPIGPNYTVDEWAEIAAGNPLADVSSRDLPVIHRHYLWADHEKRRFESRQDHLHAENLHGETTSALFLWYALLWAVIEAFHEREVPLRGALGADIDAIAEPLRRSRNAVFHVSRRGYYDERLFEVMYDPNSVPKIVRVHHGLGQLVLDEMRRRSAASGGSAGG